jgi:phage I-like protein
MNGVKKILHLAAALHTRAFGVARLVVAAEGAGELIAASVVPLDLVDTKAPEWITLMPAGKFKAIGHGEFVNGQPDAIIAASRARASGNDLPIDYDHALENVEKTGGKAIASGWIKELKVDQGAIKGRVEWTAAAAQHIADREYRFISPVFHSDKGGNVTFIARAGLTNKPAITDLPAIAASSTTEEPMDKTLFVKLLTMLGLAADATADQAIAACEGVLAKLNLVATAAGGTLTAAAAADQLVSAIRANPDRGQWIAAAEYNKVSGELAELKKATAAGAITTAIEDGMKAGKLAPGQKDYWLNACSAAGSADPLKKFLETAPVILKPGETFVGGAATPNATTDLKVAAAQLSDDEKKICAQMGLSHESFARTKLGLPT